MYMSVPIGSCGSYDPVITLKPLWGSPGAELSTWSIGSLCCIRAIQRTRLASRPLRSYTAIQRYTLYSYTSLYTIQAIQHPSAHNAKLPGPLPCPAQVRPCLVSKFCGQIQDGGQSAVWVAAADALALGTCLERHKKVLVVSAEDFLRSHQRVFARPAEESSELALRETSGQCAPQHARPLRNQKSRPDGATERQLPRGHRGVWACCEAARGRLVA